MRKLQVLLGVAADGEYGKLTAQAVGREKARLGFPDRALATGATVFFQEVVYGVRHRPRGYVARARARETAAAARRRRAATSLGKRELAVREFAREVGVSERPAGSNRGPGFIDACQRNAGHPPFRTGEQGWPWCGCACHEAYLRAGVRLDGRLRDTGWIYSAARAGVQGYRFVGLEEAVPGDLVLLFAVGEHVEMLREHHHPGEPVKTVGGNTSFSTGSQSNGGCVAFKDRQPGDVVAIVRVPVG